VKAKNIAVAHFGLDTAGRNPYTAIMQTLPTPQDLEIAAVKAGISMRQVCLEAGLTPSVFNRWKSDKTGGPNVASLQKLLDVLTARGQ